MEHKDLLDPKTEQNAPKSEEPVVVETPEELDDLQTKVHNLPESKWNLFQRIGGAAMGLLCGYLLTYFGQYESVGMYGTIAAVLLALFVPRMIEKRVKRTVQKGRVAMIIALAAWMLMFLLIMVINGVPMISKPA